MPDNNGCSCCRELLSKVDEAPTLTEETYCLDALIKQCTAQRSLVLQRRNKNRSRVVALPFEVLSLIFKFFCANSAVFSLFQESGRGCDCIPDLTGIFKEERRYAPLTLGSVCTRWRYVAWLNPMLWTALALGILPDVSVIGRAAFILELYMQNSGPFSISLVVDFPLSTTNTLDYITINYHGASLRQLWEVIFLRYPWKIKALRLDSPPAGWSPNAQFWTLEEFSVGGVKSELLYLGPPILPYLEIPNIPTLRRFNISRKRGAEGGREYIQRHPELELFHRPNITMLHLHGIRFQDCINLLIGCPNLVSYHALSIVYPVTSLWADLGENTTHSKLEDFAWECDRMCRGSFHFPSLKKLRWIGMLQDTYHALRTCFFSCSSTLRVLELGKMGHGFENESFFEEVFSILTGVAELTLSECCTCVLSCLCASLGGAFKRTVVD